jgi:hypothetical protein
MNFSHMKIEINPTKGLVKVPFGASLKELEANFGLADFKEKLEAIEANVEIQYLEFDLASINVYVKGDLGADLMVHDLEIYQKEAVLFGEPVFQLDSKSAILLMEKNGFPLLEREQEGEETIISFYHCFLDLIYKKGQLKCVEISDFAQKFE